MHDTLKKLHQVVAVSMHIRFPEKFKNPSVDDNVGRLIISFIKLKLSSYLKRKRNDYYQLSDCFLNLYPSLSN